MGIVHYLADLPRCWGDCSQGRARCTSPDLCAGATAAMADARAEFRAQMRVAGEVATARRGMACHEATTSPADLGPPIQRSPAPRMPRRRLTESALDRRIADKASRPMPLPELLLRKGAMTAHPAPTWMQRLRRAWLAWRLKRMVPRLR